MIHISEKKDCCGCHACYSICPKQCIRMVDDEEGFLYPVVDTNICNNCGACNVVCPIVTPILETQFEQKAVLFQHSNQNILRESTSGGLFSAIAEWVIEKGGTVFGAAYDSNLVVHHEGVTRKEDIARFRNSKYAQSAIGDTFLQVRNLLKQNNWVLFSGTPCQLEGLHKFLHKDYDKLVKVDVVCHACPSPKVFRNYVEVITRLHAKDVKNIMFRDKIYGYKYSLMTFYDKDDGLWYKEGIDTDVMMRAFFNNISPRPSCYDCPSKKRYRITDFTIWDCFDVEKFSKKLDNDKGVTRALLHTSKAYGIWNDIKTNGIFKKIPVEAAVDGVKELVQSIPMNPIRSSFFDDLNDPSLTTEEVFQKYFPVTLRHRFEKQVRLWSNRLGIYKIMKKIFKQLHGEGEIKR